MTAVVVVNPDIQTMSKRLLLHQRLEVKKNGVVVIDSRESSHSDGGITSPPVHQTAEGGQKNVVVIVAGSRQSDHGEKVVVQELPNDSRAEDEKICSYVVVVGVRRNDVRDHDGQDSRTSSSCSTGRRRQNTAW